MSENAGLPAFGTSSKRTKPLRLSGKTRSTRWTPYFEVSAWQRPAASGNHFAAAPRRMRGPTLTSFTRPSFSRHTRRRSPGFSVTPTRATSSGFCTQWLRVDLRTKQSHSSPRRMKTPLSSSMSPNPATVSLSIAGKKRRKETS